MKKEYCAMIGDMNKSRQLERRGNVQKKFQKVIEQINKEYKNEIASKFLITLGDEFQGILHSPVKSYHIVRHVQDLMDKVSFSFGIGIGTLATPVFPKAAIGMDGDCFYRARAALLRAKKEKRELLYDFHDPASILVNAIVATLDKQWKYLNNTERSIIQLRKTGLKQLEIAQKLGITKQAVSKAIGAATIKEMEQSVEALDSFFRNKA
jgi:SatD family (SatD)